MVKHIILKALGRIYRLVFSLGSTRECPICAWTGFMFLPFGPPGMRRYDAKCPKCGSLERHRLAFLALDRFGIKESDNTLHIAPEFSIIGLLKKISNEYYTIDKHNPPTLVSLSKDS